MRNNHGPADSDPKLILPQSALLHASGIFKPVSCIEHIVAEEFPSGTVELVGAGLNRGVENCGTGTAMLCAKTGGLNFEFLDCVDWRQNDEIRAVQEIHRVGVVVNAVEQIIVLCWAQTVGSESTGSSVAARIRLGRVYASSQSGQGT